MATKRDTSHGTTFTGPIKIEPAPNEEFQTDLPEQVAANAELTAVIAAVNALLERLS